MSEREGNATILISRLGFTNGLWSKKANFSRFATGAMELFENSESASTSTLNQDQRDSLQTRSGVVWPSSIKMMADNPIFGLMTSKYRAAGFAALDLGQKPETRQNGGSSERIKTPILPELARLRRSISQSGIAQHDKNGRWL